VQSSQPDTAKPTRSLGRSVVRIGGTIVALVAIAYVGRAIVQNEIWASGSATLSQILAISAIGGGVYAANNIFLSAGWWQNLVQQNVDTSFRDSHRIYSRSQIAKYIPGNVFHYGSRHVLGTMAGIAQGKLIAGAALEANRMIVAAVLLSALGLGNWAAATGFPAEFLVAVGAVAVAAGVVIDGFMIRRFQKTSVHEWLAGVTGMAAVVGLYLAFFAICGLILWTINWVVLGHPDGLTIAAAMGAYAAAWVVGFVVPGASAGIGVREAVMIFGLAGLAGTPEAIVIALLMRVATVVGDFLFFASAQVTRKAA
jgi:hypothetical protein